MATGGIQEDSSSLVDDVGMNCPICLEVYVDPRALSCLHTFCFECLCSFIKKTKEEGKLKNGIECPLCRNVSVITCKSSTPEDLAKSLPSNYALVSVLQTLTLESGSQTTAIYCLPCSRKDRQKNAHVYCTSCNEYQCQDCASMHEQFGFMMDHDLVDISRGHVKGDAIDFRNMLKCKDHGKEIEFFCPEHDQLCCTTCAIITHRKCGVVELNKVTIDIDQTELKNTMNGTETRTKMLHQAVNESESTMKADIVGIGEELKRTRATILEKLEVFELRMREQMYRRQKIFTAENEVLIRDCNKLEAGISGSVRMLDNISENTPIEVKFVVLKKLKTQSEMYLKENQTISSRIQLTKLNLEKDNCITDFAMATDMGRIAVKTKSIKYDHVTERYDLLTCLSTPKENDRKEPFFTGLEFLSDGRIIAVDANNNEMVVLGGELQILSSADLPFCPNDLASFGPNEIVITPGNEIHLYHLDQSNNLTLKDTIHTSINCRSISVIDDQRFAVGSCSQNIPACIVNRQGEVMNFDTEFLDRIYSAKDTKCEFSRYQGILITTMSSESEIHLYDATCKTNRSITHVDIIQEPRGVAVPMSKIRNAFICCKGSNCIVEISVDGRILSSHKLNEMSLPFQVAQSHDGSKLVVSNSAKGEKKLMLLNLTLGFGTNWC